MILWNKYDLLTTSEKNTEEGRSIQIARKKKSNELIITHSTKSPQNLPAYKYKC